MLWNKRTNKQKNYWKGNGSYSFSSSNKSTIFLKLSFKLLKRFDMISYDPEIVLYNITIAIWLGKVIKAVETIMNSFKNCSIN